MVASPILMARRSQAATDQEGVMEINRRQILQLGAAAASLPVFPGFACGETRYPTRPVRVVVGIAPGGGTDILARLFGQWLSQRLGQPFVIENRPGAGGNVGTEAVVKATPDGHTLLLANTANAINATLYGKLNFNFIRDIAPVSGLLREPLILAVNPSLPVKTVSELIAHAKAHPGQLSMASAGNGSSPHLAGELFKLMTGVDIIHVPYRGSAPALTDLLGGQVQVMFASMPSSIEHISGGKLRPLAVSTVTRSQRLPDVPTVAEFVPGYEASGWYGVVAPKNTPTEIVDRLNKEINAILADPKAKERLADLGSTPFAGSAADFAKFIAEDTEKWGKVIRAANIKPE
jgi:tripartite-type tricarboxylate transporter receptor subunit TctC